MSVDTTYELRVEVTDGVQYGKSSLLLLIVADQDLPEPAIT